MKFGHAKHSYYVVGGGYPIGPFVERKTAEREMRFLLEDMRSANPDAPEGDDFGVYIQHRQF